MNFRKFAPGLIVPFLIFAIIPLLIRNTTILHIIIYMFFFAYFAMAWAILGAFLGQLSLGHAAFFGIGAYTSTLLFINFGVSPWLGMLVGGAFAGVVGILIGIPTFRLRGAFYALATLALAETMRYVVTAIEITGGSGGLGVPWEGVSILDFAFISKVSYYYIMGALLLVIMLSVHKIRNSKVGFRFRAIRGDEEAASSVGINVFKYKLIGAGISAFFTGMLGTFYVQYTRFIDPHSGFGLWRSMDPIIYAVLGGPGVLGPIVGSFILTPISESLIVLLGGEYGYIKMMIYGAILIGVLLFRPQGIVGLLRRGWRRISQRLLG